MIFSVISIIEIQVYPNSRQNPQKITANGDNNCYEFIIDFVLNIRYNQLTTNYRNYEY